MILNNKLIIIFYQWKKIIINLLFNLTYQKNDYTTESRVSFFDKLI